VLLLGIAVWAGEDLVGALSLIPLQDVSGDGRLIGENERKRQIGAVLDQGLHVLSDP
jgi:hypothetical protein